MRWFAPKQNSGLLIALLLAATLTGAVGVLSVEHLVTSLPVAASVIPIQIPDDDGIPATIAESKEWLNQAMWTHIWMLLARPERPQWEKDWDSMWVVRYKKILQRLELLPRE